MENDDKIISQLGRFTVGDSSLVNRLSKENLSPREFLLTLITERQSKSGISLTEASKWSDEVLLLVTLGWLKRNQIIAQELEDLITLEGVQNRLIKYVSQYNADLKALTDASVHNMLKTIPSVKEVTQLFPSSSELLSASMMKQFKDLGIALTMLDRPNNLASVNALIPLFKSMGSQLSNIQSVAHNVALTHSPFFDATKILSNSAIATMTDHVGTVDLLAKQFASFDQISRVIANQMPSIATSFNVAQMSALTQNAFASINLNSIGNMIGLQKPFQQNIASLFAGVIDAYSDHIMSLGLTNANFGDISPLLTEWPTREIFTTTEFLKTISVDQNEDEVSIVTSDKITDLSVENDFELRSLLSELNSELVIMLDGATQALISENVDRVRHFTISLRELFTHIIHTLAPDNAIKVWSNNPEHFFEGRPTRKARLLFICRGV